MVLGAEQMTPNQRKEELSRAWLAAVAGSCGFALANWSQDQDCIDATIAAADPIGRGTIADPKLDIQLKATSTRFNKDAVEVQLTTTQLDRLTRKSMVPKILVAMLLPEGGEVEVVPHEHLLLRKCAYFRVASSIAPKVDGDSKVVQVPFNQPFTPEVLRIMMERLSAGELL